MAVETTLRCDGVIRRVRCGTSVTLSVISAVAARDDAEVLGWAARRSSGGRSSAVRDYCPRCALIFAKGAQR